ncbi:MAG: hypothetical protein ABW167_19630 [Baekduia sp.]
MSDAFEKLTGAPEKVDGNITPEAIEALRKAVAVLRASEVFGQDMESANHHAMDEVLKEFAEDLHVHEWGPWVLGPEGGDRERICTRDGCWAAQYEEIETEGESHGA